jgi:transposase
MDKEPDIFVGVDWASTDHQLCMIGPSGPVQRAFALDAGGLGAMVDWLCAQTVSRSDSVVAMKCRMGRWSKR